MKDANQTNCSCERPNDNTCDCCENEESKRILEDAKIKAEGTPFVNTMPMYTRSETIEEAAEADYKKQTNYDKAYNRKLGFIAGAKWKSERMFSKEEAYAIWKAGQEYWKTSGESITFEELTEKLKNKSI